MFKLIKKYLELKERELDLKEKEIAMNLLHLMCSKYGVSYPNTEKYFNAMLSVIRHGSLPETLQEQQKK